MGVEQQYPEIVEYLDTSDNYANTGAEFKLGNDRYLIVTQKGVDGQQLLFKWNGSKFDFWDNETIIDSRTAVAGLAPASDITISATIATCGPSSPEDHEKVHQYALTQVNVFDSSSGPDGGNLACCWTVRHIVYNALKRWITLTDGTEDFGRELRACFHVGSDEAQVLPGGIIISPTQDIPGSKHRNVGHVGILGAGAGDQRLVYSNSSSLAKFEQNYTVGSWKQRYKAGKGLDVLFYPLPIKSLPATS
jgi:hypothetical protein